jgi:uncharacterized protein (TIGR03067 family)
VSRRIRMSAAILAAVVTSTAVMADDKTPKGDLAKIQGRWEGVSGRPEEGTSVEYTFEGKSFRLRFKSPGGATGGLDGKFRIDETAKPHNTIDWVDQKGLKGRAYPDIPGIYALLDDDTLKLCTPGINSARPTEFYESTDSSMGQGTIVLKRKTKANDRP